MRIRSEINVSGNVKQEKESLKTRLLRNCDQFCKNTILHGLKYIADRELHLWERLFFGLSFATVIVLAAFFVHNVWERWNDTPVILGISPYPKFITREPFPAVTICNLNFANKSKIEEFSIYSAQYAMVQVLCKREANVTVVDSITDWRNLIDLLTEIAQPCTTMLLSCRFGSVKYNCSDLFEPVITDEGLCCAFNKLHPVFMYKTDKDRVMNVSKLYESLGRHIPVDWGPEFGYRKDLPEYYQPRPAVGIGETLGLTVVLDVASEEYYCSSMNSIGFKVLVHSPIKNPSLREVGLLVAPGSETKALIRTERYDSDKKLRGIPYRYRQCYFQNERLLSSFSHYTRSNCEMECYAKMLLKYCGCITFFMPEHLGNGSICSIYDVTCVEHVRIDAKRMKYNTTECPEKCLPRCHDLRYDPKFYSAPLMYDALSLENSKLKNMTKEYFEQNILVLHVYHADKDYISFEQKLFFSGTDALSSFSGLISVFFGFGFMSLAELFYFAVIRLFRRARRQCGDARPTWKRPIRKRHRNEVSSSSYRKIFIKPTNKSREFFERKWHKAY